ncbi:MAG: SsrA-binding protein SmpB [Planctomycetes bacterium]|nr:SsrA-binding protein SmpB [Planctomycetota bacterium]
MAKQVAKGSGEAKKDEVQLILKNRKLRHDYEVIDTYEAGLVLAGSEVKSLRNGDVQWADAHARFDDRDGLLWLYGLHIGEYRQANNFGHKPLQPRRLLLNRSELDKLRGKMTTKGLTLVPDQLHFRRGWAKLVICLASGKDKGDRRRDLMTREAKRDVEREVARRAKQR